MYYVSDNGVVVSSSISLGGPCYVMIAK